MTGRAPPENTKSTARPEAYPIAIVDAVVPDFCGRYIGGSHSTLCEPHVTHALSANNVIPRQPSIVWEVDLFLTALADAESVQDTEPAGVALLID